MCLLVLLIKKFQKKKKRFVHFVALNFWCKLQNMKPSRALQLGRLWRHRPDLFPLLSLVFQKHPNLLGDSTHMTRSVTMRRNILTSAWHYCIMAWNSWLKAGWREIHLAIRITHQKDSTLGVSQLSYMSLHGRQAG